MHLSSGMVRAKYSGTEPACTAFFVVTQVTPQTPGQGEGERGATWGGAGQRAHSQLLLSALVVLSSPGDPYP